MKIDCMTFDDLLTRDWRASLEFENKLDIECADLLECDYCELRFIEQQPGDHCWVCNQGILRERER